MYTNKLAFFAIGLFSIFISAQLNAAKYDAGPYHSCQIDEAELLTCTGDNSFGQSRVPENLGRVSSVSVGAEHSCVIRKDGLVFCWGNNKFGQVVPPPHLPPAVSIFATLFSTYALMEDNELICWGACAFEWELAGKSL